MPLKRTAALQAILLVVGWPGSNRVAQAQDPLLTRVAERLATQMTTEEAFKTSSLGPDELSEVAATPGGLYLVIPRGLTAVSNTPLNSQAIAVCVASATESMKALMNTDGLLETRVEQAVGRRRTGAAATEESRRIAFNSKFTDTDAAQIVGVLSDVAASDFAPLVEIRSSIARRIVALLDSKPHLLEAIEDPALVPKELQESRRRVVDLLEKAGAPLQK
jgi:hypothetical protein